CLPMSTRVSPPPALKRRRSTDSPTETSNGRFRHRPLCRIVCLYPERDVAHFFSTRFSREKPAEPTRAPAPRVLQGPGVLAVAQSSHHAPRDEAPRTRPPI